MTVQVWSVEDFRRELREHEKVDAGDNPSTEREIASREYVEASETLVTRAHARGDGVAIYVNNDLGHPDIGQWQIVSYGGDEAQLETRDAEKAKAFRGTVESQYQWAYGDDVLPKTLPDIGGRINWRYLLEAIVPSYEQEVAAQPGERLVTLTVKVTGGANEEEAAKVVRAAIDNGLDVWASSGGQCGFSDQDDTGVDTYDRGIRAEVIDAAVI